MDDAEARIDLDETEDPGPAQGPSDTMDDGGGEEPEAGPESEEAVAGEAPMTEDRSDERDAVEDVVYGDEAASARPADTAEPESGQEAEDASRDAPESPATLEDLVAELAEQGSTEAESPAEGGPEGEGEAAVDEAGDEAGEESETAEALEVEAPEGEEESGPVLGRMWTRVPFWVLGALWVAFVGVLTYLMWPSTGALVTRPLYPYLVFGGAALVVVGLVTGLTIWLLARAHAGEYGPAGIARTVWMRALGWTACGVAVWWIGLVVLDLHRTGVIR